MSPAKLTLKIVDKLASLAYTVKLNPGTLGPLKAPARAMDLPLSCEPVHLTLAHGEPSRDMAPRGSDTLIPLAGPVPVAPGQPARSFLHLLPSLRPSGPVLNLKILHSRPSLLLLPNWRPADPKPVVANTVEESPRETALGKIRKALDFDQEQLLHVAIGILSVVALYGLTLRMPPVVETLHQGWRQAQQAVLHRAAVALDEDFRAGLDDWMNGEGARPTWASDAAGFVHPGALALYRPSLDLSDYQMQFVGTIDHRALSWVVRAADFNNYYAVRITVLKPRPVPEIGVTRYAVIDGKAQNQVTTPLRISARSDTVYRVSLNVEGDRYALSVQGQPVDSWSEPGLPHGGIGFFSGEGAESRVAALQVREQYDMLGRFCAFLAPPAVASYRALVRHRV